MKQLYVPDKVFLLCSDGMKKQPIKVTSQQTVEIAGGRLAATKEDRTNGNFMCGKMLVGGAIVGAAVAAVTISTGGIGGIILGAIGGTLSGAALGTAVSMAPCFCALATMPNDWIGYHPKVTFEEHNALLENATLPCILGGKIEIIYFEEFADLRLSTIRKNAVMEAGIQALKVTAFLRFPMTFLIVYALANVGLQYYTGPHANDFKTYLFGFNHPHEGFKVLTPIKSKKGNYSISDNTSRIQQYLTNSKYLPNIDAPYQGDTSQFLEHVQPDMPEDDDTRLEGTQGNAFRHTLWQADITNQLGSELSKEVGDSHEINTNSEFKPEGFDSLTDADEYIDLQNNIIGRGIGSKYSNAFPNELADKVLDYYHEHGLWEAKKTEDGKWQAVQTKLPDEQYNDLKQAVNLMNRYGYYENTFDFVLRKNLKVNEEDIAWFKTIPKAKEY
ncbi:PAAR-like protein [Apibacter mensalis]|uniref:DUF6973 domain-containing protein n=1 Tax=Apibacter mensalis TaxID=1586267 RepID=UPI0026ECD847|nr:PAAR-like protein [Apibacter mensalis]